MSSFISKPSSRIGLALLSGVLLASSFPSVNVGWLSFVALAPLVVSLTSCASNREAILLGWGSLSLTWLLNVPWVIPVMSKYGGLPYPVGVSIYVAMAVYLGVFGALFGWLVYRLRLLDGGALAWLGVPASWIAVEYARTWLLTGFPWHLICEALIDYPSFAMPVRLIGPYGLGFLTLSVTALFARALVGLFSDRSWAPQLLIAAVLLGSWFGIGRVVLVSARLDLEQDKTITAGVLQPNIKQEVRWDAGSTGDIFRGLVTQMDEVIAKGADVVVWPESTLPAIYDDTAFWREHVESVTKETGADVILGSVARSEAPGGYTNSVLLIRDGERVGRYDKIKLVPFGEYVPMRKLLFFAEKLVRAVGEFEFGTNPDPLEGRVAYGIAICYEVMYPSITVDSVRRGAEVLVTVTNDAWFDVSAAPYQHLAMARMRAIETDRWMIRAGTTGISAIVDPTGTIVAEVPLNERGVIVENVGIRSTLTPYVRGGDWAAWVSVLFAVVMVFVRRGRDENAEDEMQNSKAETTEWGR